MNWPEGLPRKLWLYTNYDCNLRCAYCVARSSPHAPRRALGLDTAQKLVDEAVALGFEQVFFTGGEPFLIDDIYAMLAYASARVETTVLTNATLLSGTRLNKLTEIANDRLSVYVSLDGGSAEHHDAYRGKGSWDKTVAGIRSLLDRGLPVHLGTTETPTNSAHLEELCAFHRTLGIREEHHIIRPVAKRGSSADGIVANKCNLAPEITVNADGVFWHPISTDPDMLVSDQIFPLAAAVEQVQEQLNGDGSRKTMK